MLDRDAAWQQPNKEDRQARLRGTETGAKPSRRLNHWLCADGSRSAGRPASRPVRRLA